jgi:hypothetical protein
MYITYKESSKSSTIAQKGTLYVPEEFRKKYLQVSHPGYATLRWHYEQLSTTPKNKMTVRKER